MTAARRLAVAALAALLCVAALGASTAVAADECNGLMVCLPVEGPWVVVPAPSPSTIASAGADWVLTCPRQGYIVAGTDVRLSDRAIDVGIRGETGSPVAPGTTTREAVRFLGLNAGSGGQPIAYRPFIGCIPTSGGGARNQTARVAAREGLKPTRPVAFVAVVGKLKGATSRIVARCPAQARLVGWSHAIAFRTALAPTPEILAQVSTVARATGNAVTVTAQARPAALASAPEVQIQAACTRAGR